MRVLSAVSMRVLGVVVAAVAIDCARPSSDTLPPPRAPRTEHERHIVDEAADFNPMLRYWRAPAQILSQTPSSTRGTDSLPTRGYYACSLSETQVIAQLRRVIAERVTAKDPAQTWLACTASDVELLRFLRARQMDVEVAYEMLLRHSRWRREVGQEAGETTLTADDALLARHVYWTGVTEDDCAVLVVESAVLDVAARDSARFIRSALAIVSLSTH